MALRHARGSSRRPRTRIPRWRPPDFDPFGAADAAGDSDGDGVPTSVDNCPNVANADQADEDGDGYGDVCDPCPIDPETNPIDDIDGDGVSGSCDPNPSTPGDRIAVFAGFTGQPVGASLVGTWTFTNGAAHVTSSPNEESSLTFPVAGNHETVHTVAHLDALFGSAVARPIGIAHEVDSSTRDAVVCVFGLDPGDAQIYAIAENRTTAALATLPTPVAVGTTHTLTSLRISTTYQCASEAIGSALTASSPTVSSPNRVGLFARSASASFDWLLIVTSP
jgi:hypothetical protein